MKVLLIGHSYVNHLKRVGSWDRRIRLDNNSHVDLDFSFHSQPGKDFAYFLENEGSLNCVSEVDPDIVVVILGGNSIVDHNDNSQLRVFALDFYRKLKSLVKDNCVILAAQVEPRWVQPKNRFGAPEYVEFEKRRTILNNYFNKVIKKREKLIDSLILLGSVSFLNNIELSRDGIHLNQQGLRLYKEAVIGAIVSWLNRD